jgi:hypothetical protein
MGVNHAVNDIDATYQHTTPKLCVSSLPLRIGNSLGASVLQAAPPRNFQFFFFFWQALSACSSPRNLHSLVSRVLYVYVIVSLYNCMLCTFNITPNDIEGLSCSVIDSEVERLS